tara:strand:+ start:3807 stop:4583 length:777 start_codon:yes stop_codon:yes gene_type:complete
MHAPDSIVIDPQTGFYYVSNVNGEPVERNGRGFISKIGSDGQLIDRWFIRSGKSGATINAPKGLAVMNGNLYVADIDRVLRFDLKSGRLVGMTDLTPFGVVHLKDLAFGLGEVLFVSDILGDTIYKIEPLNGWRVIRYANGPQLGKPNGLIYDVKFKRLIVASWETGQLLGLKPDGSIITLFKNPMLSSLDGIAFDAVGNIVFSSSHGGSVYRLKNYSILEILRENIITPADVSVDVKNGLALVSSYKGNIVFTIPLN